MVSYSRIPVDAAAGPSITTRQLTGLFEPYSPLLTTRAVAIAAKPSPRPVRPRPSAVVADTETGESSRAERTFCASARRVPLPRRVPARPPPGQIPDLLPGGVADAEALGPQQAWDVRERVRPADAPPF